MRKLNFESQAEKIKNALFSVLSSDDCSSYSELVLKLSIIEPSAEKEIDNFNIIAWLLDDYTNQFLETKSSKLQDELSRRALALLRTIFTKEDLSRLLTPKDLFFILDKIHVASRRWYTGRDEPNEQNRIIQMHIRYLMDIALERMNISFKTLESNNEEN